MRESVIQAQILEAIGALPWLRVWRNNTGALTDKRGQLITFGLRGSADIFGVMAPDGRFLAIEVKNQKGRQTQQQAAFEKMVSSMGGLYVLARSVDDVYKALKLKE